MKRREIATWPPEERCVGLARKWKRNDRTVPSLCLPSAPEPAGKKTRLDARFAVCTIVQGFILIRRTGGTVCSVSCQLQCLSVNGNYILPGLPTRPARCPPFYRSSRNAVFCRAVEYAIPPTFLPEIPPHPLPRLIAVGTKKRTPRIRNYYEIVVSFACSNLLHFEILR